MDYLHDYLSLDTVSDHDISVHSRKQLPPLPPAVYTKPFNLPFLLRPLPSTLARSTWASLIDTLPSVLFPQYQSLNSDASLRREAAGLFSHP